MYHEIDRAIVYISACIECSALVYQHTCLRLITLTQYRRFGFQSEH